MVLTLLDDGVRSMPASRVLMERPPDRAPSDLPIFFGTRANGGGVITKGLMHVFLPSF